MMELVRLLPRILLLSLLLELLLWAASRSGKLVCLQADLSGRDFAAQRGEAVVISTGGVNPVDLQRSAAERREAEQRNQHRCLLTVLSSQQAQAHGLRQNLTCSACAAAA